AAHEKGLIHRDIKPANILLETGLETRAKITDFGLARATDDASLTQSGLIAGTPMFMAPEQAKGQQLDHRADLFSLGSVLYTMVSGRPPFRAPNTIAVLKRVCEDTPRPISQVIPETPGWLCDIIAKLHAKDPEDRFQSANDVRQALSDGLAYLQNPAGAQQPVIQTAASATMSTGTQRSGATRSRMPAWLFVVLALCILPVLGCPMLLILGLAIPAYQAAGSRTKITVPEGATVTITDDGLGANEGWQSLFNGRDLAGWLTHPQQPGGWHVENESIVGTGAVTHLFTERNDYQDFEFRGEVRMNEDGNSGVFVRTPFELTAADPRISSPPGYEVQLVAGNHVDSRDMYRSGGLIPLARWEPTLSNPDSGTSSASKPSVIISMSGSTTCTRCRRWIHNGDIRQDTSPCRSGHPRHASNSAISKFDISTGGGCQRKVIRTQLRNRIGNRCSMGKI
ncbi:MAG: hypothetical protein B7Z55_17470, partial [Planctomycetales bacterium 12-60-4]